MTAGLNPGQKKSQASGGHICNSVTSHNTSQRRHSADGKVIIGPAP